MPKFLKFNFSCKQRFQIFSKLLHFILICFCNRSAIFWDGYELHLLGYPISFLRVLQLFEPFEIWKLWILFLMSALRWVFICFLIFLEIEFKADLRKGFLDLINAFLFFNFWLRRSWMVSGMLVFSLLVFSGKWLWMPMMMSVRILAALLIILMGSTFSEIIRLEIWS